jgi:hypothetical protein
MDKIAGLFQGIFLGLIVLVVLAGGLVMCSAVLGRILT